MARHWELWIMRQIIRMAFWVGLRSNHWHCEDISTGRFLVLVLSRWQSRLESPVRTMNFLSGPAPKDCVWGWSCQWCSSVSSEGCSQCLSEYTSGPTLLLSGKRLLVSCPASCRLWWRWQQLILIRFDPRTHFYIWGVFIMTGIPGRSTLSSHRGHVITWKLALKTEQTCLWRTLNYSLNNYRALPDLTPWWEDEK